MGLVLSGCKGISADGITWAITPSSSGFIKTTKMPSCHVYRNNGGWTATTTESVLIFNSVIHNNSNAYNASTGIFTCPIAGRYMIDVSALAGNAGYAYLNIRKNNIVQTMYSHQSRAVTGWSNFGLNATVYCAVNDTIQCNYFTGTTAAIYTAGDYTQMLITMIG